MDDFRAAFISKDADSVSRLALNTVGSKDACLTFFAKVMESVARGPTVPDGLPPSAGKESNKRKAAESKVADEPKKNKADMGMEFFEKGIQDGEGSIYFLLPNPLVGSLIGKGGVTIKGLSRKSGAKLEVEKVSTYGDMRLVSVLGTLKQVTLAVYHVIEACGLETVCMLVPNQICGLIIGKQGANIKKLEKETGAVLKMEVFEHEEYRKVVVSGHSAASAKEKCHALYLITSLISANQTRLGVFDPRKMGGSGGAGGAELLKPGAQAQEHFKAIAYTTNPQNMHQRLQDQQQQQQQQHPQMGGMGMQPMGGMGMPNQGAMQGMGGMQGGMGSGSNMPIGMVGQSNMATNMAPTMGGMGAGNMGGNMGAGNVRGMMSTSTMQGMPQQNPMMNMMNMPNQGRY